MRSFFDRERLVHFFIWFGFSILINIYSFIEYGFAEGLLNILDTFLVFFWLVFLHMFWALPNLLSSPRKYSFYFLKVIVILAGAVPLSAFGTEFIRVTDGESKQVLHEHFQTYVHWVLIESILLFLVSSLVKFSLDYFKLKTQQAETEKQRLAVELKYLKLQVNPHFLFNTLNNLLLLTNKKSPQASIVVEKLAYMMRYLLEKDKKDTVPLQIEIDFLQSYIELEQIRIKDIDVSFDIEGEVIGQELPPALLVTLIENAFKHGVDKSKTDNYVHIELNVSDEEIELHVENPISPSRKAQGLAGIGLENLKKRLDLIYKEDYQLIVGENGKGVFEATLKFPTL